MEDMAAYLVDHVLPAVRVRQWVLSLPPQLRYLLRPAVCGERLTMTRQGQVVYRFRRPWRNGTQAVSTSPMTFISRLAALVPYPRAHVLSYHGVLAPAWVTN